MNILPDFSDSDDSDLDPTYYPDDQSTSALLFKENVSSESSDESGVSFQAMLGANDSDCKNVKEAYPHNFMHQFDFHETPSPIHIPFSAAIPFD